MFVDSHQLSLVDPAFTRIISSFEVEWMNPMFSSILMAQRCAYAIVDALHKDVTMLHKSHFPLWVRISQAHLRSSIQAFTLNASFYSCPYYTMSESDSTTSSIASYPTCKSYKQVIRSYNISMALRK